MGLPRADIPLALLLFNLGVEAGQMLFVVLMVLLACAFRTLDIPVLYMTGRRSTASAHGVAKRLAKALPRVEVLELEKLGHMGPITHPDVVNEAIARFLDEC